MKYLLLQMRLARHGQFDASSEKIKCDAFFAGISLRGWIPAMPFQNPRWEKLSTTPASQRKYLERYLLDGKLEIFNNRAERSIKPFVIGRKNFFFANTPSGAKASAILYSLIETAKEHGLDPCAYLTKENWRSPGGKRQVFGRFDYFQKRSK